MIFELFCYRGSDCVTKTVSVDSAADIVKLAEEYGGSVSFGRTRKLKTFESFVMKLPGLEIKGERSLEKPKRPKQEPMSKFLAELPEISKGDDCDRSRV